MIPKAFITEWRREAPWISDYQVEQDLAISRALVELYQDEYLSKSLLFRGGTALNKLYLSDVARYSEDLDLVQRHPEPIGKTIDTIREKLRSWLEEPSRKISAGLVTLTYRFTSEPPDPVPLKLKIEINTREHLQLYETQSHSFSISNRWYSGESTIHSYCLEELMATKLRALYQRKKGRDLFDFYIVFKQIENIDIDKIIQGFKKYVAQQNLSISKKQFLLNLEKKMSDNAFLKDIDPLLSTHWKHEYDINNAAKELIDRIINKL